MAHRAACGLQHRVTEAVAGDVLFAVQQDKAHAVAAVRPQEAMGDVGHLLAFGHHVQIAHGAVAGDGLIEEALAVVAKDGPDTAEGEGRTAVDVGCLTCTGACLHGSACPHHHADAGAITAHGRNVVHIGAGLVGSYHFNGEWVYIFDTVRGAAALSAKTMCSSPFFVSDPDNKKAF